MSDAKCPNCGRDLPSELGQHAITPVSGLVTCPHCGHEVHIQGAEAGGGGGASAASGSAEAGSEGKESFSGHETVEGLKEELKSKQPEE
jgi:DNA-directed RNA polymerase subunit RPC12/RpoP